MASVSIRLNGNPTPLEGLKPGAVVTLTNADNTGATKWRWAIGAPEGSTAAPANPTAATTTFTADVEGGYLVQLVVNEAIAGEARGSAVARVASAHLGLDLLAKGETNEGHATRGWASPLRKALLWLDKALGGPTRASVKFVGSSSLTGPSLLAVVGSATLPNGDVVPTVDRAGVTENGALFFYDGSTAVAQNEVIRVLARGLSELIPNSKSFVRGDTVFSSGTAGAIEKTPPATNAVVRVGDCVEVVGGNVRIHFHPTTRFRRSTLPAAIGTAGSSGSSGETLPADHVHAHGNLPGGTLHAAATSASAGFMSAADKAKLDSISGGGSFEHGDLPGGSLHALAIPDGAAGFMSGTDKKKLDGLPSVISHGNQGGGSLHTVATESTAGFMAPLDKIRLNTLWDRPEQSGFDPHHTLRFFRDDFADNSFNNIAWSDLGGDTPVPANEPYGVLEINAKRPVKGGIAGVKNRLNFPSNAAGLTFEARFRLNGPAIEFSDRSIRIGLGSDVLGGKGSVEIALLPGEEKWQAVTRDKGGTIDKVFIPVDPVDTSYLVVQITIGKDEITFSTHGGKEEVTLPVPDLSDCLLSPFVLIDVSAGSGEATASLFLDYFLVFVNSWERA